jgi:hypothetical protein
MISRTYLPKTWMDPRQHIRPSSIHGMGVFAREPIRQGQVVEIIGGDLMTEAEFRNFQQTAIQYNAVQIGEDLHLVERLEITRQRPGSINHACDSNLWVADEVSLVARRNIRADEEFTVDYALFSAQADWVMDVLCHCGQVVCRGVITGNDWKLQEVQARYHGHFTPFLNARIARLSKNR